MISFILSVLGLAAVALCSFIAGMAAGLHEACRRLSNNNKEQMLLLLDQIKKAAV